jgi:hypothetical protein
MSGAVVPFQQALPVQQVSSVTRVTDQILAGLAYRQSQTEGERQQELMSGALMAAGVMGQLDGDLDRRTTKAARRRAEAIKNGTRSDSAYIKAIDARIVKDSETNDRFKDLLLRSLEDAI